jgi:hypothetical protein
MPRRPVITGTAHVAPTPPAAGRPRRRPGRPPRRLWRREPVAHADAGGGDDRRHAHGATASNRRVDRRSERSRPVDRDADPHERPHDNRPGDHRDGDAERHDRTADHRRHTDRGTARGRRTCPTRPAAAASRSHRATARRWRRPGVRAVDRGTHVYPDPRTSDRDARAQRDADAHGHLHTRTTDGDTHARATDVDADADADTDLRTTDRDADGHAHAHT